MTDDLRTRFIEAKLAGTKKNGSNGVYLFRSNESAAEVAIVEVKKWLLDRASQIRHGSGELVVKRLAESLGRPIWTAPWNEDQVATLAKYQTMNHFHPYTCGTDSTHPNLVSSSLGWHCVACDYTQSWANAHDDLLRDSEFVVDPVIEIIKRRRDLLGLSQTELAKLVKTSQSAISDLETGSASPTLTTLRKVCTVLGLEIFLEGTS